MHEETIFLNEKLNKSELDYDEEGQIINTEMVTAMEGVPDLNLLITGNISGIIKFWKLFDNKEVEEQINYLTNPNIHIGQIRCITYIKTERKQLLFTGGEDTYLIMITIHKNNLWSINKFNKFPNNRINKPITGVINSICDINDGKHVFYNIGSRLAGFDITLRELTVLKEYQSEVINMMSYVTELKLLIYATDKIKAIDPINSSIIYSISLDIPIQSFFNCILNGVQYFITSSRKVVENSLQSEITYFTFVDNVFRKTSNYTVNGDIIKLIYCYDLRSFVIVLKEGLFYLQNIENENVKKKLYYDQTPFTNGCYLGDGMNLVFATNEGKLDFFKCY